MGIRNVGTHATLVCDKVLVETAVIGPILQNMLLALPRTNVKPLRYTNVYNYNLLMPYTMACVPITFLNSCILSTACTIV